MLPVPPASRHHRPHGFSAKPALPIFPGTQIRTPFPGFSSPLGSRGSLPYQTLAVRRSLRETFYSLSPKNPLHFPSQEEYASILELCASDGALPQGQQIHARVVKSGLIWSDGFLGTKLLYMYAKCGCISFAQDMFNEMPQRSVYTWNALIGVYASSDGQQRMALDLYREMQLEGVAPDACTLSSLVKACAEIYDVQCGSQVHGPAIKFGFMTSAYVSNALISMYGKCDQLGAARLLFDRFPKKNDVVSWNSIISACIQNEQWVEGLRLFTEMQMAKVEFNSYTTVSVLQACAELSLLRMGRGLHAYLLKCIHNLDKVVANALVVMYAKCSLMDYSSRVFNQMAEIDNVAWNSMLSGYVQSKLYNEAIYSLHRMQGAGYKPDKVSILNIASCLGQLQNFLSGRETHAYALKHRCHDDLFVGNSLVDMYVKCCSIEYAEKVFHTMPVKDHVSWTMMITAHAQGSCYFKALHFFREVLFVDFKVDEVMIGAVLQACGHSKCLLQLKEIHAYVVRRELLDVMLENSFLCAYGECGEDDYAVRVFERIERKDIISWTSMINCFVQNRLFDSAIQMFYLMTESNMQIDILVLVSMLEVIAELSILRKGKEIHGFLIRKGFMVDVSATSSLVDMYARCGDIDTCQKLFDRAESKDLFLWTTLIDANGMHGRGHKAIHLFKQMQESSLVPDHVCFLALLYACSHSGLVDEGKYYLSIMRHEYGLEPWLEHYTCMVDLLSRSGHLHAAYNFIINMPITPTAPVWCALLGGCKIYANGELGKIAASRLLELEPGNPGHHVLVCNVFAGAGEWKDVDEVRMRMKEKGLKKAPACSWIEMGNEVHSFTAGDRTHQKSATIYSKLKEITETLEQEFGYTCDTNFALHDAEASGKMKLAYHHSERLAIALGLIGTTSRVPVRIAKNLRVCGDCHEFTKLVSKLYGRDIIVRDSNRFHHFRKGTCSCGDFW